MARTAGDQAVNVDLIPGPSAEDLARAVAAAWLDEIDTANRAGKTHSVALSGGRITQKFFQSVVEQAKSRPVSFGQVHFFWADERCVPPEDKESNYRIAKELLFDPLGISPQQIHRIRGEADPRVAAKDAEAELCAVVRGRKEGQPVLDLVFLGLGEDGHIASLFPGEAPELIRSPAVYREVLNSPKPPPSRVTLGYPVLAAAREVWMLASGAGKEAALRESLRPDGRTPFARLIKLRERTKVFTDIALT